MSVESTGWNESIPVAGDLVSEGPDNFRAALTRIRARMAQEHAWPSSQTSSNQAGYHTFITLSGQTASPSLTYATFTTQLAALWASSGSKSVILTDSAGTNYILMQSGAGVVLVNGTGSIGALPVVTSGGGTISVTASKAGYVLMSNGATTVPTYNPVGAIAFCQVASNGTLTGAYGISSATSVGTGRVKATFTTARTDTSYVPVACVYYVTGSVARLCAVANLTTADFEIQGFALGGGFDPVAGYTVTVYGT